MEDLRRKFETKLRKPSKNSSQNDSDERPVAIGIIEQDEEQDETDDKGTIFQQILHMKCNLE